MILTNMSLDELCFESIKILQRNLTENEFTLLADIIERAEELDDETL